MVTDDVNAIAVRWGKDGLFNNLCGISCVSLQGEIKEYSSILTKCETIHLRCIPHLSKKCKIIKLSEENTGRQLVWLAGASVGN